MKRRMKIMLTAAMLAPVAGALAQEQQQQMQQQPQHQQQMQQQPQQQQQQAQLPSIKFHPGHGQSDQKMASDESSCQRHASKKTGFEPTALASNATPLQEGHDKTVQPIDTPSTAMGASQGGATASGGEEQAVTPKSSAKEAKHAKKMEEKYASAKPSIDVYNKELSKCMTGRGYIAEQTSAP